MTELTSFMLERLCEDGELVLFRARRDAGVTRVLVVAPALEQPVPETIARLHHAYFLAAEMDPAWAARPLELVYHEGRPALLTEDPGGDPLERLLGHPMEPPQFLRIAIGIAVALGSLHARGIIHRNVKPGNILATQRPGTPG
jgi:serine/threonine protein kinase